MDQWGVQGVIIALISFGVLIGTPLLKLNSNLTRLNVVLELFQKQFDDEKTCNAKEHNEIWDKCEQQDEILAEHDKRISLIGQKLEG